MLLEISSKQVDTYEICLEYVNTKCGVKWKGILKIELEVELAMNPPSSCLKAK